MKIVSTVVGLASASLCLAFATGCPGLGDESGGSGGGYSVSVATIGSTTVSTAQATSVTSVSSGEGCDAVTVGATTVSVAAGSGVTTGGSCGFPSGGGSCGEGGSGSVTVGASVSSVAATSVTSTGTGGYYVPWEWTCEAFLYGSGNGCDCGCGAPDPDCVDTTLASCLEPIGNCFQTGRCGQLSAPGCGFIDPYNNAYCIPATPETSLAACADGIDNDHDGLIDSADPDCGAAP